MRGNGKVIVVGDDFSPMGEDAILEGLQQLAYGAAERLHVVHVHDAGEDLTPDEERALAQRLREGTPESMARRVHYLATMSSLPYDAERIETHARVGKTVQVLLDASVDLNADLVIVGTQGRTGIARWIMGSVAESLVRKARCPVLVARPKRRPRGEGDALPESYYAWGKRSAAVALSPELRAHVASTISEE